MPTRIKGSPAGVFIHDQEATQRYLKAAVSLNGYDATITVQIPPDVSRIMVKAPWGLSVPYDVTPGQPFEFNFGRPTPAANEDPKVMIYIGVAGATDYPVQLRYSRDGGEIPTPQPVVPGTAGSLGDATIVGETLTVALQSYNGDVVEREDWIETAATSGGAATRETTFWTQLPDQAGRWFRYGSRAFGPTVADPSVSNWTTPVYTDWTQIQAVPTARRILADDVEFDEVNYSPAGQNVTFTPRLVFPGLEDETIEAMQYTGADLNTANPTWTPMSLSAGIWTLGVGSGTAHLFRVGDARRDRLRFRWRGAANQPWSEASVVFTVPEPDGAAEEELKEIFNPTAAQATASATTSANLNRYYIKTPVGAGGGDPSTPVYAKWDVFLPMLYCWAGNNGNITMNGTTKAAVEHMVDLLLYWASDGGGNAPAARSGYHGQHEMRFVATVALARITPAVWNHTRLNAAAKYKQRLDFVMKGCAIANMVIATDSLPDEFEEGYGRGKERSLRGWSAGQANVPNFSSPPHLTPHVVAAYMAENGEDLQTFVNSFNREAFANAMDAVGGITECRATFRQTWTDAHHTSVYGAASDFGRGHTAEEITFALTRGGRGNWRSYGGHTLAQPLLAFVREIGDRAFSATVKPGADNAQNPNGTYWGDFGPTNSGWSGTRYGVYTGASKTEPLRGVLGARLSSGATDRSKWASLPNAGAVGMHLELDASDGGGSGRPKVRSAMSYAVSGLGAVLIGFVTMICYGKFSPADAAWTNSGGINTRARFQVGIRDLNFRCKWGHRSYAKGGPSASNNEDWGPSFISTNGVKWSSAMVLADMVAEWWGLPAFPTDD